MPESPDAALALAVAQFAPTADGVGNLAEISRLTAVAVGRGAGVVVFPEYSSAFIDPFDETIADLAQDVDGPFTAALATLARQHGVHLVAGLLERAAGAVADAVLSAFPKVRAIKVTVHKPHAPIAEIFEDVGVVLTRNRHPPTHG